MAWVVVGGFIYLGVVLLLIVQAQRGQSVIAPDGMTLASFGLLFGLAALAAWLSARLTRQTRGAAA